MASRTLRATTAAALLLAASVACAPGRPDAKGFIDRANKVCAASARELAAMPQPTDASKLPAHLDKVLAVNESSAAAIRRLEPPDAIAADVRAMLVEFTRANLVLAEVAAAAGAGDSEGLSAARARFTQARQRMFDRAKALGLDRCAGDT